MTISQNRKNFKNPCMIPWKLGLNSPTKIKEEKKYTFISATLYVDLKAQFSRWTYWVLTPSGKVQPQKAVNRKKVVSFSVQWEMKKKTLTVHEDTNGA